MGSNSLTHNDASSSYSGYSVGHPTQWHVQRLDILVTEWTTCDCLIDYHSEIICQCLTIHCLVKDILVHVSATLEGRK